MHPNSNFQMVVKDVLRNSVKKMLTYKIKPVKVGLKKKKPKSNEAEAETEFAANCDGVWVVREEQNKTNKEEQFRTLID